MSFHITKFTRKILYATILVVLLTACTPTAAPTAEVVVQSPVPTPTLEPTFTPSPSPTDTPTPLPIATIEPTSTPPPQANLSGRILDQETGQPIAGAQVSAGSETVTTDEEGRYTLTNLSPGQYVLSATHDGYDPGLSAIFTVATGQELEIDLTLYAPDTSPYPQDPMLTNPLDPNGAPTKEDAERLARLQGLTGKVVSIEETKLRGEFLVNYKIGDDIRAAVAELNHEVWELTDETGRQWWIIKVCGNLASRLPQEALIATPVPRPLPPLAEVVVDGLVVRTCASEDCTEVGTVPRGSQVEVFGCLAKGGDWCEVGWSGGRGWCTGQSLRQLAVATVIPEAKPVPPTPTPTPTQEVVVRGEGQIVFERPGAIYIINADGSGLIRLTDDGLTPAWSPDGQRIAFARNGDIYVMNTDGSDQTNLTSNPDFHFYLDPAWSPDGQQILFTSSGDPNYPAGRLLVINDDGSGLRDLIDPSLFPTLAVWSPDGTHIAFLGGGGIQVVDANGSNLTRLTDGGGGLDWSPDGQRIAFARNGDIYVINADGSGLTRLTNHPGEDTWPAWSPDNRQIVFRSTRDGDYYIYVMNADGSGLTRLTDGNNPDW